MKYSIPATAQLLTNHAATGNELYQDDSSPYLGGIFAFNADDGVMVGFVEHEGSAKIAVTETKNARTIALGIGSVANIQAIANCAGVIAIAELGRVAQQMPEGDDLLGR